MFVLMAFILLFIASILALGTIAYFGIEQYRNNTHDTDAEKTAADLKNILLVLIIIIITSLGIIGYNYYTEKQVNVQSIHVEEE